MDMRQLRYFVMVAEELSFSRAAERLHISQPPLSQQIKALEEEMGVLLLARTRREVKLTAAGTVFLRESRLLLDQLRTAVNATVRAGHNDAGVLRLGVATSALFRVLPGLLALLRSDFPGVEVSVSDMQSSDQERAVTQGALDIGIVHVRPDRMNLKRLRIFGDTLAAALPEAHPLADAPDFSLAKLADEPMVALSREHGPTVFDAVLGACLQAGFNPQVKHTARNPMTIFQMVRVGFGVAIVPRAYAVSAYPGIRFRDLPDTEGRVQMEAIWSERGASDLTQKIVQRILPQLAASF